MCRVTFSERRLTLDNDPPNDMSIRQWGSNEGWCWSHQWCLAEGGGGNKIWSVYHFISCITSYLWRFHFPRGTSGYTGLAPVPWDIRVHQSSSRRVTYHYVNHHGKNMSPGFLLLKTRVSSLRKKFVYPFFLSKYHRFLFSKVLISYKIQACSIFLLTPQYHLYVKIHLSQERSTRPILRCVCKTYNISAIPLGSQRNAYIMFTKVKIRDVNMFFPRNTSDIRNLERKKPPYFFSVSRYHRGQHFHDLHPRRGWQETPHLPPGHQHSQSYEFPTYVTFSAVV